MSRTYSHNRVNGVCLFTTNSKTDCPSWAISPRSCTGSKGCNLCKDCYGKKGFFFMPNVRNALNQRYKWFNNTDNQKVVRTIVDELDHFGHRYFRAHVVGDFENARSIHIWTNIVKSSPDVRFWFPTKAYRVKGLMNALRKLNSLENAVVRPSATDFDVEAPEVDGLDAGATAYRNKSPQSDCFDCPGECDSCRVCWNEGEKVTYHYH